MLGFPVKRGSPQGHLAPASPLKPALQWNRTLRAAWPRVSKPDCWRCPMKKWRGDFFFTTEGLAVISAFWGASCGLLLCPRQPPEPRLTVAASVELRSFISRPRGRLPLAFGKASWSRGELNQTLSGEVCVYRANWPPPPARGGSRQVTLGGFVVLYPLSPEEWTYFMHIRIRFCIPFLRSFGLLSPTGEARLRTPVCQAFVLALEDASGDLGE